VISAKGFSVSGVKEKSSLDGNGKGNTTWAYILELKQQAETE
jgi:hypothetical protein